MLEIFDQVPCWFRILGLGSMSVEDIDNTNWSHGEDMPCGYVESH